jgi:hypothetical protein
MLRVKCVIHIIHLVIFIVITPRLSLVCSAVIQIDMATCSTDFKDDAPVTD